MEHGFLREVQLQRETIDDFERYPFNIPAVRKLDRPRFDPRVTFLIGENSCGKSTLIEAIASDISGCDLSRASRVAILNLSWIS